MTLQSFIGDESGLGRSPLTFLITINTAGARLTTVIDGAINSIECWSPSNASVFENLEHYSTHISDDWEAEIFLAIFLEYWHLSIDALVRHRELLDGLSSLIGQTARLRPPSINVGEKTEVVSRSWNSLKIQHNML